MASRTSTPTIHDVARTAEVSAATVSRHLQGANVRAADRVRQAIEDLGFRPQPAAQSLKSRITRSVAVVVPDITDPYFASVVKGVESIARHDGYNIFLYNSEEDGAREAGIIADLYGRVDGVILTPADESPSAGARLESAGMPTVLLDRECGAPERFDAVLVDNEGGAAQAARHLLELGHTDIGVICGPLDTTPGRTRHDGFLAVLKERGVELADGRVQISDFREEGGYQTALRMLALETPPTAVFVSNNLMCAGVLRALHDMRVSVPEELSVIGFDDLHLAELLNPPLTVIGRPTEEQGALAMRLLLNLLGGGAARPRRIVLDTRLVIRESCAPASPAAPGNPNPRRTHV
ncbi:MAG: LacI family DNA-binding transcriptional regulator [Solirubrobacterales bacterium]|jgi:LacI family transcriptional regulator|nr:LacI family DNA-binding transcriptional regulator [Solirubrobacterales bacterium]